MKFKRCSKCKTSKELSFFRPQVGRPDGLNPWCRDCRNECSRRYRAKLTPEKKEKILHHQRAYKKSKKGRSKAKDTEYLTKYGITLEKYNEMSIEQSNLCFICLENKKLFVDHCHSTGKVRKLLCFSCNVALGSFKDSSEILNRAKEYIDAHKRP